MNRKELEVALEMVAEIVTVQLERASSDDQRYAQLLTAYATVLAAQAALVDR